MMLTNKRQWNSYLRKAFIFMAAMALCAFGSTAIVYAAANDVQEVMSGQEDSADSPNGILKDEIKTTIISDVTTENINVDNEATLFKEDSVAIVNNSANTLENITLIEEKDVTNQTSTSSNTSTKTTATKTTTKIATKATTKTAAKAVVKESYSKSDLRLLSSLVYAEAGNQSYKGMLAVANVVLNRMDSKAYYHVNTVKEVIYDRKWAVQFSVTIKNKKTGSSPLASALKAYDTGKFGTKNVLAERQAMTKAIKAAKAALKGTNNIGKYLCFTNKYSSRSIKRRYPNYKTIGDHIFYRTV
jgi:N-acetylmuramoyl-L-alanine amidase